MPNDFEPASKDLIHARFAFEGPTNAGKTITALIFAAVFAELRNGTIGVIDTEHDRARHYAGMEAGGVKLEFLHVTLQPPFHPSRYIELIRRAEQKGITALVVDSISHEWNGPGGVLERVDQLSAKNNNKWQAWSIATPEHDAFIQAIVQSNMDVFMTTRSKMETEQIDDPRRPGKKMIQKVGMKPIQREGLEYEWDMIFSIDAEHNCQVTKTLNGILLDQTIHMPDAHTAAEVFQLLHEGASTPTTPPVPPPSPAKQSLDLQAKPATPSGRQLAEQAAARAEANLSPDQQMRPRPEPTTNAAITTPARTDKPLQQPAGPRNVLVQNATKTAAWNWMEFCLKRSGLANLEAGLATYHGKHITKPDFESTYPNQELGTILDDILTKLESPDTEAQALDAFQQGQRAAAENSHSDNPYQPEQTELRQAWFNGYRTYPKHTAKPSQPNDPSQPA